MTSDVPARRRLTPRGLTWLGACAALLALGGCQGDMSDLHQYVERIKQRKAGKVEPLPEIRPYESFEYEAHHLRSPFTLPGGGEEEEEAAQQQSGPTPDEDRRKEPLEQFPLDALTMVGKLQMGGQGWALVEDPDGVVHRVKVGNYMGQNYGRIVSISETRVKLVEIVPNGMGGYRERENSLALGGEQQ